MRAWRANAGNGRRLTRFARACKGVGLLGWRETGMMPLGSN